MRTMFSALACITAVVCGALVALTGLVQFLVPLLVLAAAIGLWGVARGGPGRAWFVLLGVLTMVGLLRGASVGAPESPRVPERGLASALLRELEVRRASEPGPRCRFEVDGGDASLTVSAPIEDCPLAQGDVVAIQSSALRPHWTAATFDGSPVLDLGRGPVVWRRPERRADPSLLDRYWHWVAARRQRAWQSSRGDAEASLVFAVGLGLRTALEPERREQLRGAGLGHLIAVSGLHVAIASLWLQVLARRGAVLVGVSARYACLLAWLPLCGYVGLTGAAASAVRAAAMLGAIDLGTLVGRPSHAPTLLATVAAAMLCWQPQWLFDPGFLLSLAAMAAIVTAPPEQGVLATSWRITWATAPISVLLFGTAPLHGLIGNAIALPLFGLMMPPALLASVGDGPLAELALAVARVFATPLLDLAAWLARLPGVGAISLSVLGALGLLGHVLLRGREPSSWLRASLPPRIACVCAVLIAGHSLIEVNRPTQPPIHHFDWIVLGSVQSRAVLVGDRSMPGRACLYRPSGSSEMWIWVLAQHGVTEIARLDASLPADVDTPPRSDPNTRALADRLRAADIRFVDTPADCPLPPAERQRAALRACRWLDARGPSLVRVNAGRQSCAIEERWVLMPESGD